MSTLKDAPNSLAANTAVHVAFGFIAMGAWAVFANRHHALAEALSAGLVQGIVSGVLTLFLKKSLERMSAMFLTAQGADEGTGRNIAALIVPPMITAATILAILVAAHSLAGTPEILATIAVPWTVSTSYAILYNLRLWRQANGR
ncbi:MAG: hypothetical protein AB7T59_14215 [Hyphomonadaceae bacterium]